MRVWTFSAAGVIATVLLLCSTSVTAAEALGSRGGLTVETDLWFIDTADIPYDIVLPPDALPSERYAAEELKSYLEKMCGLKLDIVTEYKANRRAFFVGQTKAAEAAGFKLDVRKLGEESYLIKTLNGNVAIIGGKPRGTLYGVYAFLGDNGMRWYAPDETYVARAFVPREGLGVKERLVKPAFEYRDIYYNVARQADWACRQRLNGSEMGLAEKHGARRTWAQPRGHTFNWLVPPNEYFDTHPEYFSLVNGRRLKDNAQLCLTNAELAKLVIEKVRKWMRDQPDAQLFCIGQNDWFNWCECDQCKAVEEREGTHMGSLLEFVNKVADAVKDEFPDKKIVTFAYYYTREPPRTIRPRDNVVIWYCTIDACFSHPLATCPRNQQFREDLKRWCEISKNVYVWDYLTSFTHYLMPYPNYRVLGANLRFLRDLGVKGVFEQGSYHGEGRTELAELRSYVVARLLWDPDQDDRKLIEEFCGAYYGPAAPYLLAYLDLLSDDVEKNDHHLNWHASTPTQTFWPRRAQRPAWSARAAALFEEWAKPQVNFLRDEVMRKAEELLAKGHEAVRGREPYETRWRRVEIPMRYARLLQMEPNDPARPAALEQFIADAAELKMEWIAERSKLDALKDRLKK